MRTRSNASVSTLETGLGAHARIREKLRRKIAPVSQVNGWAAKKLQEGAAPSEKRKAKAPFDARNKKNLKNRTGKSTLSQKRRESNK